MFELERRGYVKAGPYVPEVVLDEPEALRQLHREFLRAGSDVMVALTYYAHRDKLKVVGRDGQLEEMNRAAVRIAREVAAEGDALVAGNICNTWSYDPARPEETGAAVRAQYEEQLGWAADEGVDFVIAETNDFVGEALIALEVCQALGLPGDGHVRQRAAVHDVRRLRLRRRVPDARRRGRRDRRAQLLARAGDDAAAARAPPRRRRHPDRRPARPYRTSPAVPAFESLTGEDGRRLFPIQLERFQCTRFEMADFARRAQQIGVDYIGAAAAPGRTTSARWPRRWAACRSRAATRPRSSCTR